MLGRNHILVGAAAAALAAGETGFVQAHQLAGFKLGAPATLWTLGLAAAVIGSLAPDIDHAGSSATRQVWGDGLLNATAGRGLRFLLGGHRSLTHSLFAALGVAAVFGFAPLGPGGPGWHGLFPAWSDLGTAFTIGYLSHILADMLTKEGVRFLFPLSHASLGLGPKGLRFHTGSWAEYACVLALLALAVWAWIGRLG